MTAVSEFREREQPWRAVLYVERELHGIRIDSFLVRHFRNYNSWRMQRIVRAGGVTIDHAIADQRDRVSRGQRIEVQLLEPPDKLLAPYPCDLNVLYADPWIVVVDKPAGMIAHPTGEHHTGTLANAVQYWLEQRSPRRGLLRPGLVHRLDRQTSGVMVVALHHLSHRKLSAAFENGRVRKTYLAITEGVITKPEGVIDAPIGRSPKGRHVLMSTQPDALEARPARTRYQVVQAFERATLVRAFPATGRNHQIRVHFAHIGHPLIGDEFYEANGGIKPLRMAGAVCDDDDREIDTGLPIRRHALHAERLELAHPISGAWMDFSAAAPGDFRESIGVLGGRVYTGV